MTTLDIYDLASSFLYSENYSGRISCDQGLWDFLATPVAASSSTRIDVSRFDRLKASFGVCPHASFSLGHYIDDIGACLYAKAGIIQLRGKLKLRDGDTNSLGGEYGKFNKATPFFAIGLRKNICSKLDISLEFSQTIKVNVPLVKATGITPPATFGVNKSAIKVVLIYRF
jgi:hypothetical protein